MHNKTPVAGSSDPHLCSDNDTFLRAAATSLSTSTLSLLPSLCRCAVASHKVRGVGAKLPLIPLPVISRKKRVVTTAGSFTSKTDIEKRN